MKTTKTRTEYTAEEGVVEQTLDRVAEYATNLMEDMPFIPAEKPEQVQKIFNATYDALIDETIKQLKASKKGK